VLKEALLKSYETEPQEKISPVEEPFEDIQGTEEEEQPQRRGFSPPSREQILNWAPFWAVILLGAVLRFWGLGDKPLHHDESLHAYFSLQLMHNIENWISCFNPNNSCYHYDPLLHGPFQFHFIALVYKISQILGAADNGVNTTTVRILAATLGTVIISLPYFLRDYLGKWGAWLACFLLAVSPSMVYFSRFAREDIYMACFTLLLVVSVARYVRGRQMRWLILASLAFSLSYATKEATFLTVAVFGSFLAGLIVWELGLKWPVRSRVRPETFAWYIPRTAAPIALLAYLLVVGIAAKIFFGWLKALSIYVTDPKNTPAADLFVQGLKDKTVAIVPWIGIILGIYVLSILGREMYGKLPLPGRRGLAARIDPERQRILDTILTMPWTHWFFALLCGWAVFLVLFTVVFTNIRGGIGDGIWAGLYYWIQQQQVARGGQPWYYYLLLIPLYEQIGVVFGLIGVVRCLLRPTRFRLFLVYWFVGNFFLYSWAAEKMPWLMIHITMPMLLLAAIGLEPAVVAVVNLVKSRLTRSAPGEAPTRESVSVFAPQQGPRVGVLAGATAIVGVVLAMLLLLPTLHNMYEVSYVHAADGPHEMMVYVQTTTDVNIVMAKIDALDQKMYGGKHLLPIGLMNDATWPFAWYVRDYTNVCFNYPDGCAASARTYPVIISGGDNLYTAESQYAGNKGGYAFHQYHMRTWWDEGYKPPPCQPTKTNNCAGQPTWGGVGVGLWLSYGSTPPPNAKFNLGLAAQHIWQWWWYRRAIGDTGGTYDMGLFIQKNLGVTP
jgi:predicted membrane-bound mannosyltransferase